MRERAQALGGTFLIEDAATGGTRISVTLPLQLVAPDNSDETERQAV
jgi:glucose-6-phosphate-specific signal transduction histidine kinase